MTAGVSIAMATFNGGRYLKTQLASIAAQTRAPIELVVFDDGSTDQTIPIATAFARDANFPVRIFTGRERVGYRRNFMRAAQECAGELIAFCDQDDVWAPEKLAFACKAFEDEDVLLAFHNARLIDRHGSPKGCVFKAGRNPPIYAPLDIHPWMVVPGLTQVIRRSLLAYSDLHGESLDMFCPADCMPHDQWFIFLASILGRTAYVPEELVQYRQHGANTSGWLPARPLAFAAHHISRARYYARATLVAIDGRIDLLARIRDRKVDIARVDAASDFYRQLQIHAEQRSRFYSSGSLGARLRLLRGMIRQGAYTHPRVRWGLDSLLLDICVGLPAGPMLRAQ